MIPLLGKAKLSGIWPPLAGNVVLMQVLSASSDGRGRSLSLDAFYGVQERFLVSGLIGDGAITENGPPTVMLSPSLGYLVEGDVIAVNQRNGSTRVLFRRESPHNSLLVTERCDNFCLMCSQPPRRVHDDDLIDEILALIPRLPKELRELGFTGGEPTLRGEKFLEVLRQCRQHLPSTAIHVLTNGRRFSDRSFAAAWAEIAHPDLMAGIPVYSDQSYIHDYVVQSDGAFDETIRGILNLKSLNQRVEIRIVLHRHTIDRVKKFAEFVASNLRFVDHVALMGLELMGFAKANQEDLWINLGDHSRSVSEAAEVLHQAGLRTSIYNVPMCLLDDAARRFAVASISDWKREYWPKCEGCLLKPQCGGAFFSSRARLESEIRPVLQAA